MLALLRADVPRLHGCCSQTLALLLWPNRRSIAHDANADVGWCFLLLCCIFSLDLGVLGLQHGFAPPCIKESNVDV